MKKDESVVRGIYVNVVLYPAGSLESLPLGKAIWLESMVVISRCVRKKARALFIRIIDACFCSIQSISVSWRSQYQVMPGKRTAAEDLPFWAQSCNFGMVFNTGDVRSGDRQ